jgi:Glyoxalase-like domain
MIRLRQVVMVARELDPVVDAVCRTLDVEVCFRDPGVAEFGLVNALMPVGDQFIEVVSPQQDGTTAGRLLDKRGGDGGYMVIVQCDDLDRRRARLPELGIRVVWQHDRPDIRGTHLHPRDVGGAILSIDEATPPESWRWAATEWRDHVRTGVVDAVIGVTIGAADPPAMAAR